MRLQTWLETSSIHSECISARDGVPIFGVITHGPRRRATTGECVVAGGLDGLLLVHLRLVADDADSEKIRQRVFETIHSAALRP